MSASNPAQAVMRLRRARLDAAQASLAAARTITRDAEVVRETRKADERTADAATGIARQTLGDDPGHAEVRLALLDRSRFEAALAAERALEAERQLAQARFDEDLERGRLLRAQARHEALNSHVDGLIRAAAVLAEEREALDAEPGRKRK